MSVVCEACGASNRDAAMFCIGCAGRLPAFVATGPSALEAMGVRPPTAHGQRPNGVVRARVRAGATPWAETPAFWLALGLAGLVGLALVAIRHLPDLPGIPGLGAVSATPAATVADTARRPATPLVPLVPAPLARDDIGPDAPARVVAAFYGALAAGDGRTAAAIITPAKRDTGRFSEAHMTRFYGSFSEPLSVRSIRQIDAHAVEARYTYRATRTVCEGVALVRTERVAEQTLIRSIRANC